MPQPTAPPAACPASFPLTRMHPHINQAIHFSTESILDSKRGEQQRIHKPTKHVTSETSTLSRYFATPVTTPLTTLFHLPFLTSLLPPVPSNAPYVFPTPKAKGLKQHENWFLLITCPFRLPPGPSKGTEKGGRNRRIRKARSVGEKECVGVAAFQ